MAVRDRRRRARQWNASIEGLEDRCLLSASGRHEPAEPPPATGSPPARGLQEGPAAADRTIGVEPLRQPHGSPLRRAARSRRAAGPQVGFSQPTFDVQENGGTAAITVERSGNLKSRIAVTIATTTAGSAVAGVNFTPATQTLAFGRGVRTQTIAVPVLDDHVADSDLTVGLTLEAPKGKVALGAASTAWLVIHNVDSPPPPPPPSSPTATPPSTPTSTPTTTPTATPASFRFSSSSYSVNEDAGTTDVQVTRTGDLQDSVTVTVATTTAGSAVAGVNFTPATRTLTFGPEVTARTFAVPVLDDHAVDPDLTVGLALGSPGDGATLGTPSTASLVIHDVDPPPDLVIESLQATPLSSGNYQITATVTNEGSHYAGGGYVAFLQNTGTTTLNPPNADGSPPSPLADPSTDVPLGSDPIPAMAYAQTITFTATAATRALVTAELSPVANAPTPGIPGATGPIGAQYAIDDLNPQSFTVTNSLLSSALNLSNARAEIDASNSFIDIPSLIDETFTVPPLSVLGATYSVNQVVSRSFQVGLSNGSIVLTVAFADNQQALVSPDLPDIGVTGLSLTLTLPIALDATDQYLRIVNPTISVQGTWTDDLFGFDVSGVVNSAIESNAAASIDATNNHEAIEYGLNVQIRKLFAGSRILGLTSTPSSLTLGLESP